MASDARTMDVVPSWIEAHCVVPDGFRKGHAFRLYDYQLLYIANFYLVRGDAPWVPENPVLAPAFVHRRGLLVGPQKMGKNPLIASQVCVEGAGPALFAGWAGPDDGYVCRDHGCRCGWEYPYDLGEPMGMRWATPLIQITAFSEDSTENTYDALRPMIEQGPLADLIPKTGEEFIRLPGGGRIDTVTSSNQSRLGQRITHASQDELGLWTAQNKMVKLADTQYRNLSGMGGRASLTSNAWDPAQQSVAQQQYESPAKDIYRQFELPPKKLSYANKRDRRKIHVAVYPRDVLRENGGHLDLDAIENEAADLIERDLPQAARFYGNLLMPGSGRAFDLERWMKLAQLDHEVPVNADITLGFDGSLFEDSTAIVATEVLTGFQWLAALWERPEDVKHWQVPVDEVDSAIDALFEMYQVWRLYGDPAKWETYMFQWAGRYGSERVINWWMYRTLPVARAIRGFASAIASGDLHHSGDERLARHIGNAYRIDIAQRDEDGTPLYRIGKENKGSSNKMDAAAAAVLSWEARTHALAEGVGQAIWTAV